MDFLLIEPGYMIIVPTPGTRPNLNTNRIVPILIWWPPSGVRIKYYYSNETWVFDQSDNNWINQKPLIQPPPRYDTSVSSIHGTDKVLLFGGYIFTAPDIHHYFNDTWIYDLSDNTWMEIKPLSRPAPSYYHMMAPIWGTDKILMFSGEDNIGII